MTADERAHATRKAFLTGSLNGLVEERLRELQEEQDAGDDTGPGEASVRPDGSVTHFQKANLANAVRLMADNQRCLDMANRRAKRFAQWESENVLGQKHEDAMAGDDDMKISIDSPEIHHHHSGNRFGMSPLAKVAVAGLLASGIGIPAAIGVSMLPQIISALRPGVVAAPTTQPPTGNLLRDYDLFVGEPEAPAPP